MALTPGPAPAGRGGSGSRRIVRTAGEEAVGVGGAGQRLAERGLEGSPLLLLHAGGLPGEAGQEIEQAAQVLGRVLDAAEQEGRFPHLGNVGVGECLDLLHRLGGAFRPGDGRAGEHPAQPVQLADGIPDAQADERVAAAQVVVQERQRCADGEAVQPEGHFRQLDRQRVLVHAVDAAFEHHTPDDGLVREQALIEDPIRFLSAAEDVPPNGRHALDQRRDIRLVQPRRHRRDVLDQLGDSVREIVHGGDEEVAAAHRRVE